MDPSESCFWFPAEKKYLGCLITRVWLRRNNTANSSGNDRISRLAFARNHPKGESPDKKKNRRDLAVKKQHVKTQMSRPKCYEDLMHENQGKARQKGAVDV